MAHFHDGFIGVTKLRRSSYLRDLSQRATKDILYVQCPLKFPRSYMCGIKFKFYFKSGHRTKSDFVGQIL